MSLTSRPIELGASEIYFLMMRLKINVMKFLLPFSRAGSRKNLPRARMPPTKTNKQTNK